MNYTHFSYSLQTQVCQILFAIGGWEKRKLKIQAQEEDSLLVCACYVSLQVCKLVSVSPQLF